MLAALGDASLAKPPINFREGVLWVPDINTDAFFIQLKKSEAAFSPTTMYRDYPISPTLFHWESQNRTALASPTGQRYINGTSTVLLFVRATSVDEYGTGAPYLFLGPATYPARGRASDRHHLEVGEPDTDRLLQRRHSCRELTSPRGRVAPYLRRTLQGLGTKPRSTRDRLH